MNEVTITLGSLFDGSGTCPLAGRMLGVVPVWASEIEPFPIEVTKKNFPQMKHYGDITKLSGYDVEPVDILTGGSPCQDLSVAGLRKGLIDGERSSLFFEQMRIMREMREKTNGRYPTYGYWENVPGALSSNGGADFREVIQAFVNEASGREDYHVPQPKKWGKAGAVVGDGWSIAWRIIDAQSVVPQRRRRIYLVCDFRGDSAGKVLFERKSLSGNHIPCGAAWENFTGSSETGADGSHQQERSADGK